MHSYKNNIFLFNILPLLYHKDYSDVLDFARTEGYIHINGIYQWKAAFAIPSIAQRIKGNTLVKTLDDTVIKWDDRLFFYILADASGESDSDFRCINWRSPGTFQCVRVNSPTVSPDGIAGNGTSSYLNTTCVPSIHGGVILTQNDASLGCWVHNNISEAGIDIGAYNTGLNSSLYIQSRSTGNAYTGRTNDNGSLSFAAVGSSIGFSNIERTAATTRTSYKNGTSVATDALASQVRGDNAIFICGCDGAGALVSPSTKIIKFGHAGASLGAANAAFYTALNTYFS